MTDFAIPNEALILAEETGKVIAAAKDVKIVDATMYAAAGEQLKELSAAEKRIEDMRKSLKAPILAAGKAIDAFFGAPLDRITSARNSDVRTAGFSHASCCTHAATRVIRAWSCDAVLSELSDMVPL